MAPSPDPPPLSIVVPALDEAAMIAGTLGPLQALRSDRTAEVIVVDGGSGDTTLAEAAPLADVVLTADRGRARQMNAGAAVARGDILLFLHADTRIDAAALRTMLAAMRRSRRAWGRFDVRIEGDSRWFAVIAAMMNARSRWSGIATGDQAIFVRREAFAAVGGYPEQPIMEDIAFARAMHAGAGRPLRRRERVVTSGRRWQEHGVLRTMARMWQLRLRYWLGADPVALAARYPRRRRCVLQVFAKAPLPGRVKTRLGAAIGLDEAARVHAALVLRTLVLGRDARAAGIVDAIELWCEPDPTHPSCATWAAGAGATLHGQSGEDLGARMAHATALPLQRGDDVILVGTDCPVLALRHLARARRELTRADAVVAPAEDGGYVLIGLARPLPVFEGIAWSTAEVMTRTRERLRESGACWRELPMLWDVDRPEDLARWREAKCPPPGQADLAPSAGPCRRPPGRRRPPGGPAESSVL